VGKQTRARRWCDRSDSCSASAGRLRKVCVNRHSAWPDTCATNRPVKARKEPLKPSGTNSSSTDWKHAPHQSEDDLGWCHLAEVGGKIDAGAIASVSQESRPNNLPEDLDFLWSAVHLHGDGGRLQLNCREQQ
jgi:hypothetical protein